MDLNISTTAALVKRVDLLETGPLFEGLGVAITLNCDFRGGAVDLIRVLARKLDGNGADVFVKTRKLGGARDWHYPRLPGQQPRERYLGRGRVLARCMLPKQIDQDVVGFPCLRGKSRHDVAEVRLVERRLLVDIFRQESFAMNDDLTML